MIAEVDRRLDRLFDVYYDVESAERLEDAREMRAKLSEGLQESCLLLQDLSRLLERAARRDPLVGARPQALQKLRDPDELREFLKGERKVLDSTNLSKRTKDHVISLLSYLIPRLHEGRVVSTHSMRALGSLVRDVCRESGRQVSRKRHMPLLKRAVIAATGGVVAVVNMTVPFAAPIAVYSVAAGIEIIEFAVFGQLDDWVIRGE